MLRPTLPRPVQRSIAIAALLAVGALVTLAACGGPDPKTARRTEEVPANSEVETRRQNEEKLRAAEAAEAAERDKPKYGKVPRASEGDSTATVASTTPSSPGTGGAGGNATATAAKGSKPAPPAKNAAPPPAASTTSPAAAGGGGGAGKVSKAECGQLFDKYIDLEVASNPAFQGLGAELKGMIESAKQQARAQKGDPCDGQDVSRAQYSCAMGARSTEEWKKCLK